MMENWNRPNQFDVLGWVVPDLRRAVNYWLETAGVGPFFVREHVKMIDVKYRGKSTTWDESVAVSQIGPMQIILLEQHCDTPSPYWDSFKRGEGGVWGVFATVRDYDAEVARYRQKGFPQLIESYSSMGMQVAVFDTRSAIGIMTELVQDHPTLHFVNKMITDATSNWNGDQPIRFIEQPMVRTS